MTAAAPWWRRCPDRESVQHICDAVRVDASGNLRCANPECNRAIDGRIARSRGTNRTDGRADGQRAIAGVGRP